MESLLQPHGKGGNLFIIPLAHLVKILHETLNEATVPKMTDSLYNIWSTLVVGPIYLAIYVVAPFNVQIIFLGPLPLG